MELLVILLGVMAVFAILDLLAMHWGTDSREGISSSEWERRKDWPLRTPSHHH